MNTFSDIVEHVQSLTAEEQEELRQLLEKYLIEARRDEIAANYGESKKDKQAYSDNITGLKAQMK